MRYVGIPPGRPDGVWSPLTPTPALLILPNPGLLLVFLPPLQPRKQTSNPYITKFNRKPDVCRVHGKWVNEIHRSKARRGDFIWNLIQRMGGTKVAR